MSEVSKWKDVGDDDIDDDDDNNDDDDHDGDGDDADQAYPEYAVIYRRMYQKSPENIRIHRFDRK